MGKLVKDGQGSAPPWVRTPICRIEVVKPSRDVLSHEFYHPDGPDFFWDRPLADRTRRCLLGRRSTRYRRTVFEVWSFPFLKNISCVLSRNRHSQCRANKRLLWPAPAKETMASKCYCRSQVGPGALTGDRLTCGSEAVPVLTQPCSLIAHRAAR